MYLVYRIWPNIVFVIRQLSRHNFDPKARYIGMTKQVFQFLKMTITFRIKWRNNPISYQSNYPLQDIIGYANSNFAQDPDDQKSTTAYYLFIRAIIAS